MCCLTRIRTSTDSTKNCSATITPWDNTIAFFSESVAKVLLFFESARDLEKIFRLFEKKWEWKDLVNKCLFPLEMEVFLIVWILNG